MFEISRDQVKLFSFEEKRNIIFGSPGVCSDLSLPRQIKETRVKHKRSLICGFRFLIWASDKLMFCQGYICRTPNGRRARISLFWAYRKLSETGSEVLAFVNTPS